MVYEYSVSQSFWIYECHTTLYCTFSYVLEIGYSIR
jgi:hypothetical protein